MLPVNIELRRNVMLIQRVVVDDGVVDGFGKDFAQYTVQALVKNYALFVIL